MFIKNLLIVVGLVSILQPAAALAQNPAATQDTPLPGLEHLKGIVILGSTNDFKPNGVSGVSNVVVKSSTFLVEHPAAVYKTLSPYIDKPLTSNDMVRLQTDLVLLCRRLDHPVVDVFFPGDRQEIVDATVQIMVYEGKVDHIEVIHEGKPRFDDRMLTNRIHLNPGDSIVQSELLKDVGRLNLNPDFREVSVLYKPSDWTDPESSSGHGTTTVDLDVKESFPYRFFAGYDDYGLKILGEDQIFAGFKLGNLFGKDQQLNYQYTTDVGFDRFQGHAASYIIPLPWGGNSLTVFGNYDNVKPNLGEIGFPAINYNNGYTYQASLRYTIPLPAWFGLQHDFALGYDYKSANTPAFFGKVTLNPYKADVDQAVLDYHAYRPDPWGFFQFSGSGYYSPGGLLGANKDSDFATFGPALKSSYYYGRIAGERAFYLPWGFQVRGKGSLQEASTGLLPSEQIYLGGNSILRGYPESIESGDQGYYASAELHAPLIPMGNLTRAHNVPHVDNAHPDTLDLFGFFDYGSVQPLAPNTGSRVTLDSVGAGLLYRISYNLLANVSYGFQLKSLPADTPEPLSKDKSRLHVSVTLSY